MEITTTEKVIDIEKVNVNVDRKVYCLYDNKEQNQLLAMAYSKEQIPDESKYYSAGVWFEYDQPERFLVNEKLYKKKVVFPETPEERQSYSDNNQAFKWIG